ncbi:MAG: phosphatidylinositol phosphate synthase [Cellulosimicrobium cellulans]
MRERLIESRLTPNAISLTGFVLNIVAALLVLDRMFFLAGLAFIIGSIMDTLDGRYSRMSGKGTPFGAFLDSTLDRLADAAVFVGLTLWFVRADDPRLTPDLAAWGTGVALACLALGAVVPYARARAESVGMTAQVGIAERADRLVAALVAAGIVGLGVPPVVLVVVLGLLALASAVTVVQRVATVRRQALALAAARPEEKEDGR